MNGNILVMITHSVISFIGYIKLDKNKLLILNSVLIFFSSRDFGGDGEKGERERTWLRT